MKNIRKILLTTLSLVLLSVSLTACGAGNDETTRDEATTEGTRDNDNIMDDAGDAADDVIDGVGDGAKDVIDGVQDGVDEITGNDDDDDRNDNNNRNNTNNKKNTNNR
ncbi:MAG: hypothetical protein IJ054_07505 [Lachnospiraceae bacterium]|nr:hypothetical protein [Lachnospiraceae bacterium]